MRLQAIQPDVYAREVLPVTAPLWAGRRSFAQYVAQTLEIARSPYGRRHYRTIGLYDGGTLLASYKRYERTLHDASRRLDAIGFGAVFTPAEYRGRGYASVMLAMALDEARAKGYAVAYLFSDIRPQFYAALGFRTFPSREFSLRSNALPSTRLEVARLADEDWRGVQRTFELGERRRRAGFLRTPTVWGWIQTRVRQVAEHPSGHETNLVVRRGRRIAAYVLGVREPQRDAYVVDEYGFTGDEGAAALPALLRAACGDLRRMTGWLPPDDALALLPKVAVRKRTRTILMMAPLGAEGERLLRAGSASRGDFCWATEHI